MALPESKHISETLAVMLIQTATEHHKVMLDRELLCHHVKSKAGRALHTGRFHESYRPPWLLSARVRGDRNLSASAEMNLFNHKTKIIWTSALCFHPLNHFAKWSLCPQVQISVDGSTNKNKRVKWKFTYSRQNSLIVIWDQADMQKKMLLIKRYNQTKKNSKRWVMEMLQFHPFVWGKKKDCNNWDNIFWWWLLLTEPSLQHKLLLADIWTKMVQEQEHPLSCLYALQHKQ